MKKLLTLLVLIGFSWALLAWCGQKKEAPVKDVEVVDEKIDDVNEDEEESEKEDEWEKEWDDKNAEEKEEENTWDDEEDKDEEVDSTWDEEDTWAVKLEQYNADEEAVEKEVNSDDDIDIQDFEDEDLNTVMDLLEELLATE